MGDRETSAAGRLFADIAGARTAYLDAGGGPALVLVHGVGLNASVWQPQIDEFSRDYRVLAYDTLGHGSSARPPAGAALPDYVHQLHRLLDALAIDRAVLLGHSMGALIALLFALEHGERAEALIAANPVYRRPASQLATSRSRARELERGGSAAALPEALARWFGDTEAMESARVEQVEAWIRQADPAGYAAAYRVFCEADPWLDGRLARLRVPALFVTGGLDPNSTPSMARTMAAEAPYGSSEILDGERHMMAYVSPGRFNRIVRGFLQSVTAAPPEPRSACGRGGGS